MTVTEDARKDIAAIAGIDVVPTILDVICRTTGMGFAAVARVTDDSWVACAVRDEIAFGLALGGELKLETTICHEIRQSGNAVIIDHVAEDPAFCNHGTPALYAFQSYISVPIVLPDGTFFGTLCAIDPRPARLKNPETIGTFKLFAGLIALHLDAGRKAAAKEAALETERLAIETRSVVLTTTVAERTLERDRLWELSEDLLVIADYEGNILRASPSWDRTLGYDEPTLQRDDYTQMTCPEDVSGGMGLVMAMRDHGHPVRFENRIRAADGTWRRIAWTLSPEPGGTRFTGVGRDITEQAATEEALRQAQKMEAVGQLTGGLAHDFNNLLAGISGSLELMQARISQGRFKDVDRYISAAQGATTRAAALTHRLLAFSRRQTLDPRPTNVNKLVNEMEDLIRRTVGPSIAIEVAGTAAVWSVLVDPPQLENALLNLCINARDAMPDGGRITIETHNKWLDEHAGGEQGMKGHYLSLCVSDTGTGMPPDIIAKAFDPFFTTKPIGQGTGLGLSMIYGFARQSGGQVRIHSEVGEGTTVCIDLPRHYGEEVEVGVPSTLSEAPRAEQGETVLIVDDEPTVRMLVTEVLGDLGYTAIEAADSVAGLKVLQSDVRIDLLVTDVGLPGGMNGRQMAEAGLVKRPGLKVLFITGYAENAILGTSHLKPDMQVLTKPFVMEALASRIKGLMHA